MKEYEKIKEEFENKGYFLQSNKLELPKKLSKIAQDIHSADQVLFILASPFATVKHQPGIIFVNEKIVY